MNTPKKIKRTFVKTRSNPEGGSKVRFVSALQETTTLDNATAIDVSKSQRASAVSSWERSRRDLLRSTRNTSPSIPINSNRRTPDPSLASFRNMAREIKSRKK